MNELIANLFSDGEFDDLIYDKNLVVIELCENTPNSIVEFAKELYNFKHQDNNLKNFKESFRVLYIVCSVYNKRSEIINLLSQVKPVGTWNYEFWSFDYCPTLDSFKFYTISNSLDGFKPDWHKLNEDIKSYITNNCLIDDDVKRAIYYSLMFQESEDSYKDGQKIIDEISIDGMSLVIFNNLSVSMKSEVNFSGIEELCSFFQGSNILVFEHHYKNLLKHTLPLNFRKTKGGILKHTP